MVREFMIIYFLRVNDNVGIFPQHSKLNHIRRRKTVSSIVRWYTRRRNIQWWVQSFSWTVKDNILETFTFNKQMHYPDTTNCQQDIVKWNANNDVIIVYPSFLRISIFCFPVVVWQKKMAQYSKWSSMSKLMNHCIEKPINSKTKS